MWFDWVGMQGVADDESSHTWVKAWVQLCGKMKVRACLGGREVEVEMEVKLLALAEGMG